MFKNKRHIQLLFPKRNGISVQTVREPVFPEAGFSGRGAGPGCAAHCGASDSTTAGLEPRLGCGWGCGWKDGEATSSEVSSCSRKPRAASGGHSSFPGGSSLGCETGRQWPSPCPSCPPPWVLHQLGPLICEPQALRTRSPQFPSLHPRTCWAEHQSWDSPRSAPLFRTCPPSGREKHTCLTCVPLPLWCGPWRARD